MKPAAVALALLLVASAPAGALADDGVVVSLQDAGHGAYTVAGSFSVSAPDACVWSVLTDYDGLGGFIPGVRSAVVKREGAHVALVAQDTTTTFLAVRATSHVVLRVEEEPCRRIAFTDVANRDFDGFTGAWKLERIGPSVRVTYEASARPRFMPPVVGPAIFKSSVAGLLSDLKTEVLRRQGTNKP
jgi:carbon monoxide dehydrogenase subunit G